MRGFIVTAAVVGLVWSASAQQKGTFTDKRDKQTYKTVTVGGNKWMAENLNVKTGTSWCYDNQESNCKKYGRLYAWSTAAKMACPEGWHLPTRDEWGTLAKAAGGTGPYGAGGAAGTKLKSKTDWNDGGGTDQFGFSALPGGLRFPDGTFSSVGVHGNGYWWAVTQTSDGKAYARGMSSDGNSFIEFEESGKDKGFSVRCVEGEATESVIDVQPKQPKASDGGDGKLLQCIADENGDCITKFEYDKQNRITIMYNGADVTRIIYTDNFITAGDKKFALKGNTVTAGKDTLTIDKNGYIVRRKDGGGEGCSDSDADIRVPYLAEYQYKDGNLTTISDNGGDCEILVGSRTEYEYHNRKSPFSDCKTPKWLLQCLLNPYYASKNNIKTIDYGADSFMIIVHKYEYDGDGFPTKRTEECGEGSLSCDPGSPTRYIYRKDK
jgi:uncharacterized protein (TIGR02145 family)